MIWKSSRSWVGSNFLVVSAPASLGSRSERAPERMLKAKIEQYRAFLCVLDTFIYVYNPSAGEKVSESLLDMTLKPGASRSSEQSRRFPGVVERTEPDGFYASGSQRLSFHRPLRAMIIRFFSTNRLSSARVSLRPRAYSSIDRKS